MARGTVASRLKRLGALGRSQWMLDWLSGAFVGSLQTDWVNFFPQVKYIPFNAATQTLTSEYDLGWDLPTKGVVLDVWIDLDTVDATETLSVGLLSGEAGGDADGFLVDASVATAGIIRGTTTIHADGWPTATTFGVLFMDFTAGSSTSLGGLAFKYPHILNGTAKSVTVTASAGTDTAAGNVGVLFIPMV